MKKNLLFVVDNLKLGGVTRVLCSLLCELAPLDFNIDLLVLHYYEDMKIDLPKQVNIIAGGNALSAADESFSALLKSGRFIRILNKLFFAFKIKTGLIKNTIKKDRKKSVTKIYDTEIAFGDGFPFLYTAFGDSKRKLAWMHSDVCVRDYSARYFSTMKKALSRMDACVAVSEKVAQSYKTRYGVKNVTAVHNIMNQTEIIEKADADVSLPFDNNQLNLVSVGRLDYSKNYEMLVQIAKRLYDDNLRFKLYIIGDGDERDTLTEQISSLGLTDTVFLLGRKDNPYPFIKNADLFVLSSRYEGLPTVLYEAIILKTPCVSTDVAGAREILKDIYGIITDNNEDSFYDVLKSIIENPEALSAINKSLFGYEYSTSETIQKVSSLL